MLSAPSKTFNIAGLQTSVELIPNEELRARYQATCNSIGLMRPNAFGQGYTFGQGGKGFLRMNIACSREALVEALKRMERTVNELR